MKLLLVQRHYMHYRKPLIEYIKKETGVEITVIETNTTENRFEEGHISLKSTIFKVSLFNKRYEINFSPRLSKYITENHGSYDMIILEGTSNLINNIFLCRILKKRKIPYVLWDAGRRIGSKMTPLRRLLDPLARNILIGATACMAYSTAAKDYFVSIGVPEERIFVCKNTLNVSYFDKIVSGITSEEITALKQGLGIENKKIILYVGVVEKRKRVEDLILAYQSLRDPGTALVIVGGGEHLQNLKDFCSQQKVENVIFTGQVIEGVMKYFLMGDVFALPSEGGLALNQAMICAKPVIASSADGTERDLIIHGKNGYFFKEGCYGELAACIRSVFSNDFVQMGAASRKIIADSVNESTFKEGFMKAVHHAINAKPGGDTGRKRG